MFEKVLVANRGEIARPHHPRAARDGHRLRGRLLRARPRRAARPARRRGLPAGRPDRRPRATSTSSRSSRSAGESGAEAVHPGYGFLAENAAVRPGAARTPGSPSSGRRASAIEAMGSKTARARADEGRRRADRPRHDRARSTTSRTRARSSTTTSATRSPSRPRAAAAARASASRWTESELEAAFEGAAREGEKFFSDATVYLERYLPDPRHVEVQVLADRHGNVIHLGERDCSVQRRHQKVIEESPAPAVDEALRERIGEIGVEAARAVDYVGAGTIEGLLAGRRVLLPGDEHARAGRALRDRDGRPASTSSRRASAPRPASRCRSPRTTSCCAATRSSAASTPRTRRRTSRPRRAGSTTTASRPGPGVRVDSRRRRRAARSRRCTTRWSPSSSSGTPTASRRPQRMLRALDEYEIEGLKTLIPFHIALLQTEQWANGETCRDLSRTRTGSRRWPSPRPRSPGDDGDGRRDGRARPTPSRSPGGKLRREGHRPAVRRRRRGATAARRRRAPSPSARSEPTAAAARRRRRARLAAAGQHVEGARRAGQTVEEGQLVCIIEAMKMENEITAHKAGVDRGARGQGGRRHRLRRDDRGHQERRLIAIRA